jgi:hypothetical protein
MTVASFSARCGFPGWFDGAATAAAFTVLGTDGRGEIPDESGLWASGGEGEGECVMRFRSPVRQA